MKKIEAASAVTERANAKLNPIEKHQEKITTVNDVLGKRRKDTLGSCYTFKEEENIDINCMILLSFNFKIIFC